MISMIVNGELQDHTWFTQGHPLRGVGCAGVVQEISVNSKRVCDVRRWLKPPPYVASPCGVIGFPTNNVALFLYARTYT